MPISGFDPLKKAISSFIIRAVLSRCSAKVEIVTSHPVPAISQLIKGFEDYLPLINFSKNPSQLINKQTISNRSPTKYTVI